jgi:hypothetical protein
MGMLRVMSRRGDDRIVLDFESKWHRLFVLPFLAVCILLCFS